MTARPILARVAIARKELGLDEETYRAILERLTGHRSAKDCTDGDLGRVLDEFKAKGWTPKPFQAKARAARPADHPAAKKARALWISLHQLGVVRDRSDAALESFARRQLKVEALQWADKQRIYKLIEALKAMAERAGWRQDGSVEEIKARLQALLAARRAA